MGKEIERKFLVRNLPGNLGVFQSEEILQGYIPHTDTIEERLRLKGNRYFHTFKSKDKKDREESDTEIGAYEFEKLWPLTTAKLEKTRFRIPYAGRTIELDIYYGKLSGLITAEVEFDTLEQQVNFVPPSWFGEDVTENERYKNRNLAAKGLPH